MAQRYVCIHGHFYQPPRENPWLEAVETQDSAAPYHDWNERVTVECYAPNASSRILDKSDRILKIVNNYASISFNFGPTLLSWLETRAPDTYDAILEADRISRARFSGHGCAIAQAYNHVILPLANERDKRTQVRWGIKDFERRFGRKPEGMWLPETAVDIESLEALAAEGIRFTILEPHQVARHRAVGDKTWTDANGGLDPTRPYRCNLPSGRTIDIFLYDGPISRAVAFENLLSRGENFANRLIGAFRDHRAHPQIVNIATDGETYGHHHRFGDMALAYAIDYIESNNLARVTNYGEYLERYPPQHELEIAEDTSWSCAHGLERWRSDCGCDTGADPTWNQKWRGPLRDSFDWLRDQAGEIFEQYGAQLLRNAWQARDDYIDVVLDRSDESLQRFLTRHALPGARPTAVLELLEMQRNAMLMYTSCGWFFNDISGIEAVQVLNYAARVVQLAERIDTRRLEREFASRLSQAHSNLPDLGTGRDIYEREVMPTRLDLGRVGAHYAVASLFDSFDDDVTIYCYRATRSDFDIYRAGRARMAVGNVTIESIITREQQPFDFAALHLGETELTGGIRVPRSDYEGDKLLLSETFQRGGIPAVIRLLDQKLSDTPISIRSLFRDEQRRILNVLCNATLEEAESAFRQLHERYDPLMRFHARLGIPLPKVLQMAAEFDLNIQLRRLLESDYLPLAEIEARLREARDEHVTLDETTMLSLKDAIDRVAGAFRDRPEDLERLETYESVVSIVRGMQVYVNLRKPQNDYYRMMSTIRPAIASNSDNGATTRWLDLFDTLGEKLLISPEARV